MHSKKIAVFVSGTGSNLQNLIDRISDGTLPNLAICLVVSSNSQAPARKKAEAQSIPTYIQASSETSQHQSEQLLSQELEKYSPDLLVFAGYMKILGREFIQNWGHKSINLHPSLLPALKGLHTHKRAIAENHSMHGASIHYLSEELDAGELVVQAGFPVQKSDTATSLESKVRKLEYTLLPFALKKLLFL